MPAKTERKEKWLFECTRYPSLLVTRPKEEGGPSTERVAKFKLGLFQTEDPEKADFLRNLAKDPKQQIVEIKARGAVDFSDEEEEGETPDAFVLSDNEAEKYGKLLETAQFNEVVKKRENGDYYAGSYKLGSSEAEAVHTLATDTDKREHVELKLEAILEDEEDED